MGLMLRDGDYVPDGAGGLRRVSGREALLQRALFRLTARRGSFPFMPELGSRLWQLGGVAERERQGAAVQYAAEALEGEGLTVEEVVLKETPEGGLAVTVKLSGGDAVEVEVE